MVTKSLFNFVRHTGCFPKQLQHFHPYQWPTRVPISPDPHQHLYLSEFLILEILVAVK